jgi:hypothetical protein
MTKFYKKILVTLSICVVLFAAGVTAAHHHLPGKHAEHNCEICSFINTANAVILPAVLLMWIVSIFVSLILILKKGISSENLRLYSSRSPPSIILY